MYDYLIKSGMVIDGSGKNAVKQDVAVLNGKIVKMGENIQGDAKTVIDASDAYVTPGFVDIHRHADIKLLQPDFGEAELRQGLTTIVNGNCGLSAVPCTQPYRKEILSFLSPVIGELDDTHTFETFGQYMDVLSRCELPLNVGMDVGNGTVRACVKGYATGSLDKEELFQAQTLLRESLDAGALGVTLGIVYAPEYNYTLEEFVEVLRPMKDYNVPLVTHIRGEGDTFHKSIQEVIEIARRLEVPLHISHFKCIGNRNWGHGMEKALKLLDEAREHGMDVSCDTYPYTAGSTQLIQILPPEYLEGGAEGIVRRLQDKKMRDELTAILKKPSDHFENLVNMVGFDNIVASTLNSPKNAKYSGLSISEIARIKGMDPYECVYDLFIEENCNISMIDHILSEDDVRMALSYPYCSLISDSIYPAKGLPHPRMYGAFTRMLCKYVRDERLMSIEEAVRKMTSLPAQVYRLDKGLLAEGKDADINIFKLENLNDPATYDDPKQFSKGFDYVFVGGEVAVHKDTIINKSLGKAVLRK